MEAVSGDALGTVTSTYPSGRGFFLANLLACAKSFASSIFSHSRPVLSPGGEALGEVYKPTS